MNVEDYTKMAADQEYVGKISSVKYRLKADDMIRQKSKDKNLAKIASESRAQSRI